MRPTAPSSVLPLALALAALLHHAPAAAQQQDVALSRVSLSAGGVAYLEHSGTVRGTAALNLTVRRDQLDDVLKSVMVFDDAGRLLAVRLLAEPPPDLAFRDLPFDRGALERPEEMLAALRGVEVAVGGPTAMGGRIVSVVPEPETRDGGTVVPRHRVTLLTAEGLRSFVLETAEGVSFADAALGARISQALASLAAREAGALRRISIIAAGEGERAVRVGYVVASPAWKATYRLTLGGEGEGRLQGWAMVENLSGSDWRGVELSLVSGSPVTFRQDLATAVMPRRPTVPVELPGVAPPPPDAGAAALADAAPPPPPPAPRAAAEAAIQSLRLAAPAAPGGPAALALPAAEAAASQVVFRLPGPVDLPNGEAALLPIADRAAAAARVAYHAPAGASGRTPFAAVRLRNAGAEALPPGAATIYLRGSDGGAAFAGDARLPAVPAGEERLLAFALDRDVSIDREERGSRTTRVAGVADGVLRLTVTERTETAYAIRNAAGEARTVVIDHPRPEGWTLVPPQGAQAEQSAGAWRLTRQVPAGQTATLTVAAERPRAETVALADADPDRLLALVAGAQLTLAQRGAIERLASLRADVARAEAAAQARGEEAQRAAADQARIRDNLRAVPEGSDLARRFLADLAAREDQLAAARRAEEQARAEAEAARGRLARAIAELRV
jgi:hypothetical protein